jgi:hypothetical protein
VVLVVLVVVASTIVHVFSYSLTRRHARAHALTLAQGKLDKKQLEITTLETELTRLLTNEDEVVHAGGGGGLQAFGDDAEDKAENPEGLSDLTTSTHSEAAVSGVGHTIARLAVLREQLAALASPECVATLAETADIPRQIIALIRSNGEQVAAAREAFVAAIVENSSDSEKPISAAYKACVFLLSCLYLFIA